MNQDSSKELKINPQELGEEKGQEKEKSADLRQNRLRQVTSNFWTRSKSLFMRNRKEEEKPTVVSVVRLPHTCIRISYSAILALVVLGFLANKGLLDNVPNLKWFIESALRLVDALFGFLRGFLEWVFKQEPIGVIKPFFEWARTIWGM